MSEILLVQVSQDIAMLLRQSGETEVDVTAVSEAEDALARVEQADAIDVVIIGTLIDNPVRLTQRLCRLRQDLAVLILSEPEHHEPLTRAVQFSPFLNSMVFCESTGALQQMVETFNDVVARTRQRHRYANVLRAVQEQVPAATVTPYSTRPYLETLLDHAPIGIVLVDANGYVLEWNRQAGTIFGVDERQAVGRAVIDLFPEPEQKRLNRLVTRATTETQATRTATLERRRSDGAVQHVDVTAAPILDTDRHVGALLIFHDSTARVRAEAVSRELSQQRAIAAALSKQADELRQLNQRLEQRNRDLQDFAYVASHDLQEPLRKVTSFSDLLYRKYGHVLDETGRDYLQRMQEAGVRMRELVRDLLAFARVETRPHAFETIDLDAIATEVLSDLELLIEETGGTVEVGSLPTIEADPTHIRQLLQNLISNGLKFHKEGVAPVVRVSASLAHGEEGTDLEGQEVCRLAVQDNGIGFDEEYADRIFSPLQRLHGRNNYAGTGMGLAICRRIAERHDGTITAHSTPGEGSRFVVVLPVRHSDE